MTAIIDGQEMAAELLSELKKEVEDLVSKGMRRPGLDVIMVGDDPASKIYVKNKENACKQVGINSHVHKLSAETQEKDLLALIQELNKKETVDGILCQLPIPKHLSKETIITSISPEKDVDGFHPINSGHLFSGGESLLPCTAAGIIHMLEEIHFEFEGKNALVIGRSNIVGKPTAILLLNKNCTVTIAHSKSRNIKNFAKRADLLVTSVGKEKFITTEYTHPEQVIIDVSINHNHLGKVVGDVDYENVKGIVKAITPVPGGVGPMTIAMLLKNTMFAYKGRIKH